MQGYYAGRFRVGYKKLRRLTERLRSMGLKLQELGGRRLFLVAVELLYVNGVLHLEALEDAGLVELLTTTELLGNAGLFKLSLELLERALDVFVFLNGYYDHGFVVFFIVIT